MGNSKFQRVLAIALTGVTLAFGSAAQAATITVDPLNAVVGPGSTFDITVIGRDFNASGGAAIGTIGGGFSIAWDPSVLTLNSYVLNFAGDQTFGQLGTLDSVAGTLSNADVTSLNGTSLPNFDIAVLTFSALANGFSPTDVSIGVFGGGSDRLWADSFGSVAHDVTFVDGSVRVVPIPAAVWMLGSGLLGLMGMARRRNAT